MMKFNTILVTLKDSTAGTVIALLTGNPRSSGSMPGMGKKFFFHFKVFIPALERTQLWYSMCYQGSSPGIKRQGVKLTTYLNLVPGLELVKLYRHSQIWFNGVYRDKFTCQIHKRTIF